MSLPKRGVDFSTEEWRKYSTELLYRTLPQEAKLIEKVGIEIIADDKIVAESCSARKTITVSKGRISFLEDETEYAILLAHELGHIKKKHFSVIHYAHAALPSDVYGSFRFRLAFRFGRIFGLRPFSETFEAYLFAKETEQEISADMFAVSSLPSEMDTARNWAATLVKLGERLNMWSNPFEPCAKMHLARVAVLEKISQKKNSQA